MGRRAGNGYNGWTVFCKHFTAKDLVLPQEEDKRSTFIKIQSEVEQMMKDRKVENKEEAKRCYEFENELLFERECKLKIVSLIWNRLEEEDGQQIFRDEALKLRDEKKLQQLQP